MSEEEEAEEETEPTVELGEGRDIEGAPLARVASRQTWPQQASRIRRKEEGTTIRTPTGPRKLEEVLAATEMTYFASRQEFYDEIESVIGIGPVQPTE